MFFFFNLQRPDDNSNATTHSTSIVDDTTHDPDPDPSNDDGSDGSGHHVCTASNVLYQKP